MIPDGTQDVEILSIGFRDDFVEITFAEARDQNQNTSLIKVLNFAKGSVGPEVDEMLSDIVDIVDIVLDKLRNIPERISGRRTN
mgnify:CR=1 FL=1